jgi:predicted transcriptional regulator
VSYPKYKNADYIEIIAEALQFADRYGESGCLKSHMLTHVNSATPMFDRYLDLMIKSEFVRRINDNDTRPTKGAYVVTDKGRQFVKLVKEMYNMCGFKTRPRY